jgi:hypothetical protein
LQGRHRWQASSYKVFGANKNGDPQESPFFVSGLG